MDYKIIVDSCCDMTQQLKDRLGGIISVPLSVRLGQKEYIDDDTLDVAQFIKEMGTSGEKVSTAAPPPQSYQSAIEGAVRSFVVTLSDKLSSSFSSAYLLTLRIAVNIKFSITETRI